MSRVIPGKNYDDTEDVEYFRQKLFAALRIPPPKKTPLLDLTEQVWAEDEETRP